MEAAFAPVTEHASPDTEGQSGDLVSQCLALLSRKDDTSRFVGLAMILSISSHVSDPASIFRRCIEVLNPVFLDRLLKAGTTQQKSTEEAKDMVELAVNVINALARSLPGGGESHFLVDRTPALVSVLRDSSTITAATILQILLVFATGSLGAQKIIQIEDLSPIVEASSTHDVANHVLQHAFTNALGDPPLVKVWLDRFLHTLGEKLETCERGLRLNIFALLGELLVRTPSELIPSDPSWTKPLYLAIRATITSGPSAQERRHCVIITASLLHAYSPDFFFQVNAHGKSLATTSEKSFVYLLLQLVTIDLRAAFPSLLEQLASPSYPATMQRLAADFDIIAAFLSFLVNAEDFDAIGIEPNLLLKLRNDIGETFGLTIEFLRDRWDAAYAGAAGFEPGFEQGVPKGLTWDSPLGGGPERDALVVGSVRALAFWLKEDEGLRKEAGGLMDVFLGLWTKGMEAGMDYRPWIVGALEGILEERHGRAMFLQLKGWKLMWDDLRAICSSEPDSEELQLAIGESRILVAFVKEEGFSHEAWARELVAAAVDLHMAHGLKLELGVMVLSLATECVTITQGPDGRFMKQEIEQLRSVHELLQAAVQVEEEADELMDILGDVAYRLST